MDENEVRSEVRELVLRYAPEKPAELASSDVLAEVLGYDSLSLIELALGIQLRFDVDAGADSGTLNIVTVGDVEDLVWQSVGATRS